MKTLRQPPKNYFEGLNIALQSHGYRHVLMLVSQSRMPLCHWGHPWPWAQPQHQTLLSPFPETIYTPWRRVAIMFFQAFALLMRQLKDQSLPSYLTLRITTTTKASFLFVDTSRTHTPFQMLLATTTFESFSHFVCIFSHFPMHAQRYPFYIFITKYYVPI